MVFPLHDDNPTARRPWATWALMGFLVMVFALSPVVRSPLFHEPSGKLACQELAYYQRWGTVPAELVHGQQINETSGEPAPRGGCLPVPATYHKNIVWSVVTGMFVHAGWPHLVGNLLFLWVFGNNVEDRFGRVRFLVFFLFSGIVAAFGWCFFTPDSTAPMVGASGAISGVLGAYLVLYPRAKIISLIVVIPVRLRAWITLTVWFLIQAVQARGALVSGQASIGFGVHVIGFLMGAAYGGVFRRMHPPPLPYPPPAVPPGRPAG